MSIKLIISQEFYDTTKIPDALDMIAVQIRHGKTSNREAPTWRLVDDDN